MTWAEFIDGVTRRLTDNQPSESSFTEAQTEYVLARISLVKNDSAGYQIHQNRYSSMRRKLVGFQTDQDATAQQAAVRTLLSMATAGDALFVQAASLYVKSNLYRDSNRDSGQAKLCMDEYIDIRNTKLLGYTYTGNDAALLAAVIATFFVTTPTTDNTAYLTSVVAAARKDIETQAAWFNAQIAAAASDLQGLNDRVLNEIRAAAIEMQRVIEGYRVGHVCTFDETDVMDLGYASQGTLPEQAQVRSAFIVFPVDEDDDDDSERRRKECVQVPWEERREAMVNRKTEWPLIAISAPGPTIFVVSGHLDSAKNVLELTWDGLKLDFEDDDTVPFDEGAMACAAYYVQRELATEFGDTQPQVERYDTLYRDRRMMLYVEMRARGQVKESRFRGGGGWPSTHHHHKTNC